MISTAILAGAALIASGWQLGSAARLPLDWIAPPSSHAVVEPGLYREKDRAVTNWRAATRATLEPAPLAIAAALFASGLPVVTRCVKLNNPWCIKRARWAGEIGGDDEGHTAFHSTEAGADAAATLLRTYYVSLGRRSALDIVRRWAPAECRIGVGSGMPLALAVRGLSNTLRGRFLASRGGRSGTAQPRAAKARSAGVRVSSVPLAPMPTFRVPDLAPGMGERATVAALPARRSATREAAPQPTSRKPVRVASAGDAIPLPTASACGSEEGRIQYYGSAIAKALGLSPSDDLSLFDAAGQPTDNLLPVMVAMSVIELGYLHAGPELADGAITRLRARLAAAALPAGPPEVSSDAVAR
ncbi:hypothetical protein [uncultured Enterovirga sp.]|uniref:hypothetical protein n=1 Tax=uncultured Enterovirga sp. TaxID=2026352 RepID=UPI0035CC7034